MAHYEGDDLIVHKIEVGDMENNTYVLECPETREALLIDCCFEAGKILSQIGAAKVVAIVQTHGHFDHVQVLAELKEKLGVPVAAHPAEEYPVPIDRELSDGEEIAFGGNSATFAGMSGGEGGRKARLTKAVMGRPSELSSTSAR